MSSRKQNPLEPAVHWDTQPAVESAGVTENRQQKSGDRFSRRKERRARSRRMFHTSSTEEIVGDGCYYARRKPGAE